jgi:hypothetical protein
MFVLTPHTRARPSLPQWQAGAYLISLVVGIASIAWPYTRVLLMALSLVAPPSLLSASSCEGVLLLLDATGKLAMMDFVMLSLLIVAFSLDIPLPSADASSAPVAMPTADATSLSPDFLIVQVRVMARLFYLFLPGAVGVSLFTSHLLLSSQRAATAGSVHAASAASDGKLTRLALCRHEFARMPLTGHRALLPRWVRISVPALLLGCAAVILFAGTALPSFTLRFDGAVGLLLAQPTRTYSLIEVAALLPSNTGPHESSTIAWILTSILFATVIAAPFVLVVVLVYLWITPMTITRQAAVLRLAERLYAWSCLDVFLVTIVLGLNQLPQYAVFMIGDECERLFPDHLLEYFAPLIPGRPTCIELVPTLEAGAWVLLASVGSATVVGLLVMHAARRTLSDRGAALLRSS